MSDFKEKFYSLLRGFSRKPMEEESMNSYEKRALRMQEDLKSSFSKILPKDPKYSYTPAQWAVRTSMDEIRNFGAMSHAFEDVDDSITGGSSGMNVGQIKDYAHKRGEKLDENSAQGAYVIVECNIDHEHIKDPAKVAREFMQTLASAVARHNPNSMVIRSDALTALSNGQKPQGSGALFEAQYNFKSTEIVSGLRQPAI